jgi:hypothetical protein
MAVLDRVLAPVPCCIRAVVPLFLTLSFATATHAQAIQYCIDGPCGVRLVGVAGEVADPHGEVTLRIGLAPLCTPVPNATVWLDTDCGPDVALCALQPGWGGSDACPRLIGFTNSAGEITFRLVGSATNFSGAGPGYSGAPCSAGCITVRVNGVITGRLSAAAYDQNSSGGVNPADISVWLTDSFSGRYFSRSDFDFNNVLSPADLSLLLDVSLDGLSQQSCNFYCL